MAILRVHAILYYCAHSLRSLCQNACYMCLARLGTHLRNSIIAMDHGWRTVV